MDLLEQHPIGQIVPAMSADERSLLRNDIVINGLLTPIVRYEGKILGGWHRYPLCIEENIEPRLETKPKPLTSARDDTVNMLSDVIVSHI